MYAIVKTGGKQYRVEKGQTLLVERLSADEGATVALEPVLLRSDEPVFDAEGLSKVKVDAKVLEHIRGPKIRVFKYKPKRGYKRTAGHRQELTRIEVTEIALSGRKPAAKKAAAEPEATASAEAPAAKTATKTAAKKTTARKPAAKKTTAKKPAADKPETED